MDLDYKLLKQYHPEITENPTAEEWQELAEEHCVSYMLPRPNATVFTGGGMHLKYIYEEAATSADLDAWQYAQKLLLEQFRTLGADPAAVDAARVLRLTETQNQKSNPEIRDRKVRVISAESQSERKITLTRLIEGLEASKPANPEVFNELVAERRKRPPEQPKAEEYTICPKSEKEPPVVPEQVEADWKKTILRPKFGNCTYLRIKIGDNPEQIIETSQLREVLRRFYGTPNVKVSLCELKSADLKAMPEYIPGNYVLVSKCPGATFEEQRANIFKRCYGYREVGIPYPNQIIQIGSKLLVVWKYISGLPGYALSRWKVTQEFLCRHFEDYGAMEKAEYLTETALLPIAGFEYDEGQTARLEYVSKNIKYTFDQLATAVLNFSQEEVRKYEEQKQEEIAKRVALRKPTKELAVSIAHTEGNQSKFMRRAYKRLLDILTLWELRKDEHGEIPQGTRELSVFWALVCARQAGLIRSYEEFKETAQKFIETCGIEFQTECRVETVQSAFWKNYQVSTSTLIGVLQITPAEQEMMKVLKEKEPRQCRAEWLAEHDQERRKPWIALKISRATYFRWKKAGKLPCVKVYDPIPLVEKKSETGISYIMTAAFVEGVIELCERYLGYLEGLCGRRVWEKVPVGGVNSLGWCRRLRWLMVKSKLLMKRRRRSRPRRKRRRCCDG